MNILIDIRLLASGKFSGIEEYTRHLVNNIIKIDQDNSYTLFYNSFKKRSVGFGIDMTKAQLKRYYFPNKILDASIRFLNVPKIDSLINTDLIFSPHFNIVARSKKTPRVLTVHDLSFVRHPEFFSFRKRFWHWLQAYRKQIQASDHIIAVSESTKHDLVELLNIPEERIARIYSGIDPSLHKLEEETLASFRTEKDLQRPFFLYLAALEPRKNVVAIIQAFTKLKETPAFKEYELVLAGSTGWLHKEIFDHVKQSQAYKAIRMLGQVSGKERLFLYNCADVFIYPSFFEGFGFPPLEAQACGTPVIASNRSSLPEILGNSALLVDPWRIDDIVVAMKALIEEPSLRENMIKKGFENSAKFNWEKSAKLTIDIFRSFL